VSTVLGKAAIYVQQQGQQRAAEAALVYEDAIAVAQSQSRSRSQRGAKAEEGAVCID
jgi:hypothetical protein